MEKIKLDPETSALILIDLQHGIVAIERALIRHPRSSQKQHRLQRHLESTVRRSSIFAWTSRTCCKFQPIALTVIPRIRRRQSLRSWFRLREYRRATLW